MNRMESTVKQSYPGFFLLLILLILQYVLNILSRKNKQTHKIYFDSISKFKFNDNLKDFFMESFLKFYF